MARELSKKRKNPYKDDGILRAPMPPQDYPESGSVEWVDQFGNHRLRYWYPVTYYRVTDRLLESISQDVPITDRDVGPREMPQLIEWLKKHTKTNAKKVISSTMDEIEVTKKHGKRKRAAKSRKRKA